MGRFNLTGLGRRGTCYLAETELASFVEVFRDLDLVTDAFVATKRVTKLRAPAAYRLADCTSGLARQFGVTLAIHSTEDYKTTQAWAEAFAAAGFDGIRYTVRHDPRGELVGVALFGEHGDQPGASDAPRPVSPDVLADAEQIFGIRVRSTHEMAP